jgi:hypothetical protein
MQKTKAQIENQMLKLKSQMDTIDQNSSMNKGQNIHKMPLRKMAAKQTITISQRKISAKDSTRSRIDSESRQAPINHTASVQYYSNKNNRKSQDNPIINVTSKPDLKSNEL